MGARKLNPGPLKEQSGFLTTESPGHFQTFLLYQNYDSIVRRCFLSAGCQLNKLWPQRVICYSIQIKQILLSICYGPRATVVSWICQWIKSTQNLLLWGLHLVHSLLHDSGVIEKNITFDKGVRKQKGSGQVSLTLAIWASVWGKGLIQLQEEKHSRKQWTNSCILGRSTIWGWEGSS